MCGMYGLEGILAVNMVNMVTERLGSDRACHCLSLADRCDMLKGLNYGWHVTDQLKAY